MNSHMELQHQSYFIVGGVQFKLLYSLKLSDHERYSELGWVSCYAEVESDYHCKTIAAKNFKLWIIGQYHRFML